MTPATDIYSQGCQLETFIFRHGATIRAETQEWSEDDELGSILSGKEKTLGKHLGMGRAWRDL